MFLRFLLRGTSSLLLIALSSVSMARNHPVVIIPGGDVHLRGELTESGCMVATESKDMHIDMGQYTNTIFSGTGSEATLHIPFSIHLTGCSPELAERVGISFYGMTDPKEPDVFRVTSGEGSPVGVSGGNGFSGLGLIIDDQQGKGVEPTINPKTQIRFQPREIKGEEVIIPFTAHYRATSRKVYPGPLHSDVWFRIVYP